jgi:hypothetical protein
MPFAPLALALLLALPGPAAAGERAGSAPAFDVEIPARVAALRSDLVPEWMARLSAEKADTCHSTTPCGSAYPSCAGWSGYSDCGDPICGIYRWCGDCGDPFGWDLATRQRRERFRVCFNQFGQSCTEYQNILVLVACGC